MHDQTPHNPPGRATHPSTMQESLRDAVRQLLPDTRRTHRQSHRRKAIVAGRSPVCRRLELVIDEAVRDGVSDEAIEHVGLVFLDVIRQKLEARRPRPLGVPSLGAAIRDENAVEGEMAPLEIDALMTPSPGGLRLLKWYYLRHSERVRVCLRAIDAQLRKPFLGGRAA